MRSNLEQVWMEVAASALLSLRSALSSVHCACQSFQTVDFDLKSTSICRVNKLNDRTMNVPGIALNQLRNLNSNWCNTLFPKVVKAGAPAAVVSWSLAATCSTGSGIGSVRSNSPLALL